LAFQSGAITLAPSSSVFPMTSLGEQYVGLPAEASLESVGLPV
jgi:hypothetical protein